MPNGHLVLIHWTKTKSFIGFGNFMLYQGAGWLNVLCVTLPFGNFNVRPLAQLYKSLKEKVTFIIKKNEKKKKTEKKERKNNQAYLVKV